MIPALALVAALALFFIEGVGLSLFGIDGYALNMPLCVTVYLGLNRNLMAASSVLLLLLLPAEWFYASPFGYHAIGLVAVFLTLRLVRGFVQTSTFALVVVGFGASILQALVMIAAVFFSRTEAGLISAIFWGILPAAVIVAIAGPIIVVGLRKLEREEQTGLRF